MCVKYTGILTLREMLGLLDEVDADPEYDFDVNEFDDFTELQKIAMSPAEILKLVQLMIALYRRRDSDKLNAIIAPPWIVAKAISVFARVAVEGGVKVKVVESFDEGFAFLSLPPSAAEEALAWFATAGDAAGTAAGGCG
ncbi:hypothetical protein [Pseudaestuariivita atlantica]|uniref:Uncharacterized protein n=1 Tax=Pseudaestuariivita atlantica TaxID=1317121 RepID=A0A0L1JRG4_9RHOB|nr:hypothetical protein [Pseudaestuariivita atlantica]KNG94340.1 hypothetical protein ATO11_09075 [Pseudaestuariivita atlantica]